MKNEEKIVVYTPSGVLLQNKGCFRRSRLMFCDLVVSLGLTWQLFVRDFRARYRQSVLGILWAILLPSATITLFTMMNNSGLIIIPEREFPYPVYAMVGISLWSFLVSGISGGAASLTGAGSLVAKINFPRISLVLASLMQSLVDLVIRVFFTAFIFFVYGFTPDLFGLLVAAAAFVPLLLLVAGVGSLFAVFSVLFRDTSNAITIILSILMLITPVLYPINSSSVLGRLNIWNPLNYLINVPRDFILRGHSEDVGLFLFTAFLCVLVFWLCWTIFFVSQERIAERI